jgi:hypothetical protein
MGNRFVVKTWELQRADYGWREIYRGESMEEALVALVLEKQRGGTCVVLEWR